MNQRTLKELSSKATRHLQQRKRATYPLVMPEPVEPLTWPTVEAVLVVLPDKRQFWELACPHCGDVHRHSCGWQGRDIPQKWLGHHFARCTLGAAYVLTEAPSERRDSA